MVVDQVLCTNHVCIQREHIQYREHIQCREHILYIWQSTKFCARAMSAYKFWKISALVYVLYKPNIGRTFENLGR